MENILLGISFDAFSIIQFVLLCVTVLCALFVIIVVLIQPSNSNGISAISGGQTDTFYGKNRAKTLESKLRKLTVFCLVLMALLMVAYFILELFKANFVG